MSISGYSPLAATDPSTVHGTLPTTVEAALEEIADVVFEIADVADDADTGAPPAVPFLKSRPIVAGGTQGIESLDCVAKDEPMPTSSPHIRAHLMFKVLEQDGSAAPAQLLRMDQGSL